MERALRSRATRPQPAKVEENEDVKGKEAKGKDAKQGNKRKANSVQSVEAKRKKKRAMHDENSNVETKTQSNQQSKVNSPDEKTNDGEQSFYDFESTDESEAESKKGDENHRDPPSNPVSSSSSSKISRNFYSNSSSDGEDVRPQPPRKRVKLIVDTDVGELDVSAKGGKNARKATKPAPRSAPLRPPTQKSLPKAEESSNEKGRKPLDKNMIDFLLSTPTKDGRGGPSSSAIGDDSDDDDDDEDNEDEKIKQLVKKKTSEEAAVADNRLLPSSPIRVEINKPARKRVPLRCSPVVNSPPPKILSNRSVPDGGKVEMKGVERIEVEKTEDDDDDERVEKTEGNERRRIMRVESATEFFNRFSKAVQSNSPKKKAFTRLTPKKEEAEVKPNESGKKFFGNEAQPQTTKPLTSYMGSGSSSSKKLVFSAKQLAKSKTSKGAKGAKAKKWAEKYKRMHIPKVEALPVGRRTPSPLPTPEVAGETSDVTSSDSAPSEIMTENRKTPSPDIGTHISVETVGPRPRDVADRSSAPSLSKRKKSVSFSPLPPSHRGKESRSEKRDEEVETKAAESEVGKVGKAFDDGGGEDVEDIFGFGFGFVDQKSEDLWQEEDRGDKMEGEIGFDEMEVRGKVVDSAAKVVEEGTSTATMPIGNLEVVTGGSDERERIDGNEIERGVEGKEGTMGGGMESNADEKNKEVDREARRIPESCPGDVQKARHDLDISDISAVPNEVAVGDKFNLPLAGPSKPLHPFFLQKSLAPTTSTPKAKSATAISKVAPTPSTSKRSPPAFVKKAFEVNDDGKRQMMLDLGQKNFGARQCPECDMVYTQNHPNDEIAHKKFHESLASSLSFPEWKKQRVVKQFVNGKIVQVIPSDPKYMLKKVKEMEEVMNQNLGFLHRLNDNSAAMVYLYVAESRIVGCCIAQQISSAFKVIVDDGGGAHTSPDSSFTIAPHPDVVAARNDRVYYCSKESTPALVGINRIWVLPEYRRKQVASRLLDSVRSTLIYGTIVEKGHVAFTDPTPDGRRLASKYSEREDFLVYNL